MNLNPGRGCRVGCAGGMVCGCIGGLLEVAEAEVIASLPEWLLLQPVSGGLQLPGCL